MIAELLPPASGEEGAFSKLTPLRDAKRLSVGLVVSLALAFIRSMFVFHVLGPTLMGAWKSAAVVDTVHESARMGVLRAMAIRVPMLDGAGLKQESDDIIADSASVMLWLGVVLAGVFFAVSMLLPNPDLRLAMRWMAALALVTEPYVFLRELAGSRHRFDLRSNETIIRAVIECSAAIALCWALKLSGLGAGMVASVAFTAAYLYKRQAVPIRLKPRFRAIKELIRIGAPFSLSEAAYELLRRLDVIVMAVLLGPTFVGYYGVSRLITDFTMVLCQKGVAQVLSPHLLHTFGRTQSVSEAARYFEVPARLFCYAVPPFVAVATIWVREFVLVFLPQYKPGIPAAEITMWTIFFVVLHSSVSSFAIAVGMIPSLLRIYGSLIPTGAVAQYLMIHAGFGLKGAAWCTLIMLAVVGIAEVAVAKRRCGSTCVEVSLFVASLLLPVLFAMAATFAVDQTYLGLSPVGYAALIIEPLAKSVAVLTLYLPILAIYERKFSLLRAVCSAR
jgi:O-antigen/teichoic acid export membrane protein